MKTFKQYIFEMISENQIENLQHKLKETSDEFMRQVILRKIEQLKLSKK